MRKSKVQRVKVPVAQVVNRYPKDGLRDDVAPPAAPATATPSRPGRRRKDASDKAKVFAVTLWPAELEAFEQRRADVNARVPFPISRSDFARVAVHMLLDLSPKEIIERAVRLKRTK